MREGSGLENISHLGAALFYNNLLFKTQRDSEGIN